MKETICKLLNNKAVVLCVRAFNTFAWFVALCFILNWVPLNWQPLRNVLVFGIVISLAAYRTTMEFDKGNKEMYLEKLTFECIGTFVGLLAAIN